MFDVKFIPFPETWINCKDIENKELESIKSLIDILDKNHDNVAAFIGEPLVQGAGGMRMCREEFLNELCSILKERNIITIFDEVMTGFGRLGTTFAFEQTNYIPDIICLSKGLTGGFLPLALTITSEEIYNSFLDDDFSKAFAHGHSYTANPLGCAAAIASLDILKDKNTQKRIKEISELQKSSMEKISNILPESIFSASFRGTIAAFNLGTHKSDYNFNKIEPLKKEMLNNGFLIRPLGNVIYTIPPYCIKDEDLLDFYEKIVTHIDLQSIN